MDPAKQWSFELERFVVFCRDVIDPAVYSHATPLDAAAFQCKEPIAAADARKAKFTPVKLGWQWGPRWSTAWFKIVGKVPPEMAGKHVVFRFSTDTEALLWMPEAQRAASGSERVSTKSPLVPHHGLDANRDAITLHAKAKGNERIELYVEAACNHMFGDRGLQWDPPEIHRRWNSKTPGLFERCELAVRNDKVLRLKWLYAFVLDLAKQCAPDSARAQQLFGVLRRVTNSIPDDAVAKAAPKAIEMVEAAINAPFAGAAGSATVCHAVGHAHIDTAWLWPLRETKRKCLRTFSTVLRNMEKYPEYRFLCSQAQQYAYVEERSPELFKQISKRVKEGRWEPGGGMWIEPDCTAPSGESLIRQCLYADRYWREKFGDARGKQRFLYLPDTFGFPAQLPQIMRHCGLDTFITNKLHWNSHTVFPHTTFLWRGLDGSTVLAHQTPGMDYNATNTPRELIRGEKTHKNKDIPSLINEPRAEASADSRSSSASLAGARWLQPFGYGDGGGGPTDWSIEYAKFAEDCDALPRVKFSSTTEFCDALHADVKHALKHDPSSVPTHDGELYLELHRGTYTTHARIKQANAECEELLRQAEILTFAGPTRLPRKQEMEAKAELDRAWKLLLLNQFHDILPGSSIGWVYEDAERDYAEIRGICQKLIDAGKKGWAAALSPGTAKQPVCVINLSNSLSESYLKVEGRLLAAPQIGPLSARVVDAASLESTWTGLPVEGDLKLTRRGLTIEQRWLTVTFDRSGRIADLIGRYQDGTEHLGLRGASLNQLALYEDRPRMWDAWDIDEEVTQKEHLLDSPCDHEIVHDSPECVSIRFMRHFGRGSRVTQTYTIFAASSTIDVQTDIDWREEHRLLRALFPLNTRHEDVRLGTQFGWRRPLAGRGAFELPFQRFIGDEHTGVTLFFPDKYGMSLRDGVVGVSLLRSSRYPDPNADIGLHSFRWSIETKPVAEDNDLCQRPCLTAPIPKKPNMKGLPTWSILDSVFAVEAIKPSEEYGRLIVRLANTGGSRRRTAVRWNIPVKSVEPVDGLERPITRGGFSHDRVKNVTLLKAKPFEIISLAVTRAD